MRRLGTLFMHRGLLCGRGRRRFRRQASSDAVLAVVVLTAGTVEEAIGAGAQVLAVQLDALPNEHARAPLADGVFA